MKNREPRHYVRADMLADYLDEHDGELPRAGNYSEPNKLNYGCAGIDNIDSLIKQMYGDD